MDLEPGAAVGRRPGLFPCGWAVGQYGAVADSSIPWPLVLTELAGGIALLLIGVGEVSRALKALSGTRLKRVLQGLSGNRFSGAATGAVATALVQSSSVTTVLTVSFVSASLMTVTQAAAVVIGANLGTTVTAQIVALDITEYSLAIVALGGVILAVGRSDKVRLAGRSLFGLGLVFLGLAAMSDAMMPLRDFEPFTNAMSATANPFIAAAIGAAVAAIIQSSSATTGIVVAMSAAGLIGLPAGIALVLGANIGTCVTALLAAIGRGAAAMQTAVIHVLVNLLGALFWLLALDLLVNWVELASGSVGDAAVATPRELANAHTLFNAVNTLVFLAMLPLLVGLARRIVPDTARSRVPVSSVSAADPLPSVLPTLLTGVDDMAGAVRGRLAGALNVALSGSVEDIHESIVSGKAVRQLHQDVVSACGVLSEEELGEDQRDAVDAVLAWGNGLELISAQTTEGLLRAGRRRITYDCTISPVTTALLTDLHDQVLQYFDVVTKPVSQSASTAATPGTWDSSTYAVGNVPAAQFDGDAALDEMEETGSTVFDEAYRHLGDRLLSGSSAMAYAIEVEMVTALENVASAVSRLEYHRAGLLW